MMGVAYVTRPSKRSLDEPPRPDAKVRSLARLEAGDLRRVLEIALGLDGEPE
jgi:hypothetical protein